MKNSNFHLSLPCLNLKATKRFYRENLKCSIGRSSTNWCDINLHGNQVTFIQDDRFTFSPSHYNFKGSVLPTFHFGVLLDESDWAHMLKHCHEQKIISVSKVSFLEGEKGEHSSFFVSDPNNYLVEFKCFKRSGEVFSTK